METNTDLQPISKMCYKCNTAFNAYLNSNAYSSICPKCGTVYNTYNGVLDKTALVARVPEKALDIPLGTKGQIHSIPYIVVGYADKFENGTNYHWDEYVLVNPVHGIAYLSQYDGHWTYLKEINAFPRIDGRKVSYEKTDYDLFSRYKSKLGKAVGEFPFRFSTDDLPVVEEFVRGAFMISKERSPDNICWFKGEYIEPSEIQKAFGLAKVPERKGVGMIQPFLGKFKMEGLKRLLILLTVIWGLSQWYFAFASNEDTVFSESFVINDSLNKKEIYSRPFDLKHGTKNVEIKITTNIDNNWMYTGVTLVNEKTGDLYDVDLEAEYYHGYDGGESWSEGENWVSKVVSQVPEGRYSMAIYPEKPTSMSSVYLTITVTRDVFVFSNGLIVLLLLAIFPGYYFYRKNNFEKKRWYNSNYSPYDED